MFEPAKWRRAAVARLWAVAVALLPIAAIAQPSGQLEVHYIDVGQADAILVQCPNGEDHMLIDSGDKNNRYPDSATNFKHYLDAHFGRDEHDADKPVIEVAVASHPHSDHIANMQWVLENYDVVTYVDNGHKYDSTTFGNLDKARQQLEEDGEIVYIDGKKQPRAELEPCPDDADVSAEIFVPWAFQSLSDPNDRSVIVRLAYKDVVLLFTGDAHDKAEEVLESALDDDELARLEAHVLKVGHHGSDTSSTPGFVALVDPQYAVVSAGAKNTGTNKGYKHPRLVTLRTFATHFKNQDADDHPLVDNVNAWDSQQSKWRQHRRRDGMYLTPEDGTIVLRTDGAFIEVQTE